MKALQIIIALLFICILSVNAQDEYFDNPYADSVYYNTDTEENKPDLPKRTIRPSIMMGTSFSSFGNSQSAFSTYTKPGLIFSASPKLSISTGVMFVNSSYNTSSNNETDLGNSNLNTSMAYFYSSGIYQVNDKLIISGTVVKEIGNNQQQSLNPSFNNYGIKSGSVSFLYKLGDNIYLGAEFGVSNGRNPFNNYYNSPFHSPFNQPIGW